jgi:hypothetical protein
VVRIVRAKRTRDNTYCYWPVFTPQEEGTGAGDNRCCRTGSGFSLSHYGFGKGTVVVCVTGSRREMWLLGDEDCVENMDLVVYFRYYRHRALAFLFSICMAVLLY